MIAAGLLSLAFLVGAQTPDARLERYRWTPAPRLWTGIELRAGAAAVRASYGRGTQKTGLAAAPALDVALLGLEGVARIGVVRFAAADLSLSAAAGRTVLRYSPDHLDVPPLEARLPATGMWTAAAGLEVGIPRGPVRPELAIERSFGWLPAAHRSGEEIVRRHDRIGFWKARVHLIWRI